MEGYFHGMGPPHLIQNAGKTILQRTVTRLDTCVNYCWRPSETKRRGKSVGKTEVKCFNIFSVKSEGTGLNLNGLLVKRRRDNSYFTRAWLRKISPRKKSAKIKSSPGAALEFEFSLLFLIMCACR